MSSIKPTDPLDLGVVCWSSCSATCPCAVKEDVRESPGLPLRGIGGHHKHTDLGAQIGHTHTGKDNAEGREIKKGRLIARYAMNGHKEQTSSLRWPSSVAKKSGSCSKFSSPFGGNSVKKSNVGGDSEVARDATLNERNDSTTECKARKCFPGLGRLEVPEEVLSHAFLEQLAISGYTAQ